LIVALAEFILCIGRILAAIPALLVAVIHGESAVLLTFAAFLLIHQFEGNLVAPLIQRRMVFIPPALVLLGIAAIGALAGVMGSCLRHPLSSSFSFSCRRPMCGTR
jgi:predicted PurR-regulated permease PerM